MDDNPGENFTETPAYHEGVLDVHTSPEMFAFLNDRSTEHTQVIEPAHTVRSSAIAGADMREAATIEGNHVLLNTATDHRSTASAFHSSTGKSSFTVTPMSSQAVSFTQESHDKIETILPSTQFESTSSTDHITSAEPIQIFTETASSSGRLSTSAHSTLKHTSVTTPESSTRVMTTADSDSPVRTSEVPSSTGAMLLTTAHHDVTTSDKTTSSSVTMTTQTSRASAGNTTLDVFTSRSHPQYVTSSEIGGSSGFNSSVASTTAQALPINKLIIFGAAGLAVLFIVFTCIVIACICKRRKRKNSGIDEFDYSFDLKARQRRLATGPSRVSYSFTHNSFSDIPGTLAGLGSTSATVAPSNMTKSQSNSDNLLNRYNLEPNMYISDEPEGLEEDGRTPPIVQNDRRQNSSDGKFDRNDGVNYSTFKRPAKGVELAEGFQGDMLV